MNNRVSSLTKEIKGLYTQIEEAYYSVHKDDSEEAFRGAAEKIKGLEAQIADVKQQGHPFLSLRRRLQRFPQVMEATDSAKNVVRHFWQIPCFV